jgi:glycosyltransferase involved in cell wall biosynthesis
MNKKNPLAIILTWLEKIAYTHSDAVVSLLVNGLQHMQPRGLSPEKFKYIPNGISLKTDKGEKSIIQDDLQQIKNEGNFLVLYTGAHGVPNALENLILSAKYLAEQKNENVKFILIGDGKEKNRLKNIVNEFGLNNVQFFDPIPKSQVHNILQIADACYIGAQKTNLYKFGVSPNKLFDYMLAEKPVIFAIDSPNNPVSLSQGGVCVAPNNPLSLTNEILRLTKLPKDELKNMGLKGRQYVLKNHDYSVLANKYLELF